MATESFPRTLHLTSKTVPLVGLQKSLARKNRARLPGWTFRIWSDADNDRLIRERFPRFHRQFQALPFGVMRADIARLAYLHAFGGWYSDTDYEWLREPDCQGYEAVLPLSRENSIGNAVLGSSPGHPIWMAAIDLAFSQSRLLDAREDEIEWLTGPGLLTRLWPSADADGTVLLAPRSQFHSPVADGRRDGYGIHHTAGSWRSQAWRWRAGLLQRRAIRFLRTRERRGREEHDGRSSPE